MPVLHERRDDRLSVVRNGNGIANGIGNGIDRQECLSYMNGGMTGGRWCVNGMTAWSDGVDRHVEGACLSRLWDRHSS